MEDVEELDLATAGRPHAQAAGRQEIAVEAVAAQTAKLNETGQSHEPNTTETDEGPKTGATRSWDRTTFPSATAAT